MPNTNPYQAVIDLEERISKWAGSKYAVATDSCTSAIFLSLMYRRKEIGGIGEVTIPRLTYPSVPCSIIHAGGTVKFSKGTWQGVYQLNPLKIIDGALRFRKNMYEGGLHCLSFHIKKLLPIGRGGMILTDSLRARDWLRKARFDGRSPIPLSQDNFTMLGWNCYMTPEQGSRGCQLFELLRNKELRDLDMMEQGYPYLDKFPIYQQ